MQVISDLAGFKAIRSTIDPTIRIGFVPTMGALHEGHASLVERSRADNEITIVSIFVNPTQFGPHEDFHKYPRKLDEDALLLEKLGVDYIFAPQVSDIYPNRQSTGNIAITIPGLTGILEGKSRPGHFEGVLLVVSILFNIVRPHRAYFGIKDYQQCLLIQHLVKDLHFPLEIIPCPILRAPDGLALSSRNAYLSEGERRTALSLSQTLSDIKVMAATQPDVAHLEDYAINKLNRSSGLRLDYFEIVDGNKLQHISYLHEAEKVVALVAAYVGKTRLIDNIMLKG